MVRRTETLAKQRTGAIILAAALLLCGEARAQSSGGGLSNLFGNIFSGQKSGTAPQPQATPGPDGSPPPWSGEDGASGHPLMTASAIRQAPANFDNYVPSMWPDAARPDISQENIQRLTSIPQPRL